MSEKPDDRPSFFKVLVNDDFSNSLRIPPQFLKHIGSNLHNEFVLWNRQRRYWLVYAEKDEETLWFKKGWGDFVRDNALKYGDFLVFFYTGNSNFDVIVYGKNCCEKISVIANTTCQPQENQFEKKSAEKSQPSNSRAEIVDIASDDADEEETTLHHHPRRHQCPNLNRVKSNAAEAASRFSSTNPHFQVLIAPSYVTYLTIPKEFWQKYVNEKRDSIMLQVSEKSWLVKLNRVERALRLGKGWRTFVKDNCIQIRDICIFEKIEESLHVTICRA